MNRNGFSLVEVMIAVAILGIVMFTIFTVVDTSQDVYASGITMQTLQDTSRRVLYEMADELRQADPSAGGYSIATGPSGDQAITFRRPVGYNIITSTPLWSADITYGSDPAAWDPDDGVDNDGNGVVDERRVFRQGPPAGNLTAPPPAGGWPRVYIADLLQEGSLIFTTTVVGGVLNKVRIDLTFERRDNHGRVLLAPGSVTVQTRN